MSAPSVRDNGNRLAIRSRGRILTTHAGSLPRPPPLVELYARRSALESIDEAPLQRVAADVVWAKLRAMRDGAEIASKRLF